jgi:YbbR domain-containing protein
MRDIRVIVDLTNLEEGVHTVEPSVEILPQDLTLEDISPTSVEVTISQGPTPTPGS